MSRVVKPASSALKRSCGTWAVSSQDKAELFASIFADKFCLPDPVQNEFSDLSLAIAPEEPDRFPRLRVRCARQFLLSLRVDSGTGPDLLPARVLKTCARELALPVCLLARSIVSHARWPASWCEHWLFPLYKRQATSDPDNYRGLHLTPQLSKVVERLIGSFFLPRLERIGAYGPHQFAYRQQHGARDALLFLVLSWLLSFARGFRVALYCSDVSGAFDHVKAERLCDKLRSFGVQSRIIDLISSWLRPRTARVVVGGQKSHPFPMHDMVYQRTFYGPPLWNTFFSDSYFATRAEGFEEVLYADDLNAWKAVASDVTDDDTLALARNCQSSLHAWGEASQVRFDVTKESTCILSRTRPLGDSFKILGVLFDVKLIMSEAVEKSVADAYWRVYSLVRTRRFHNDAELVGLFKAHVLSFIEYRTSAVYHASSSVLAPLDAVQTRFMNSLGISAMDSLMHFNLAPLNTRRDMSILGVIHGCVLGLGPSCFSRFFRSPALPPPPRSSRRHRRHLEEPAFDSPDYILHSAIGATRIYNLLPDFIISAKSVARFQSRLQCLLRARAPTCADWMHTFSPRVPLATHPLRACRAWRG